MQSQDNTTMRKIAILGGTGKEGQGLAMRWALAGYSVIIGSRKDEKAKNIASSLNEKLGINSIVGMENQLAAKQADVCVLTVVQSAHRAALESLKTALKGKILIDATARVDFRDPKPPEPPAAARVAQDVLGENVRVVAAFQNVPAHALKKNLDETIDADVLICSDDRDAAVAAVELTESAGMNAYFAGGLDNALTVEGLTALLININKNYGIKTASIHISGIDAEARKNWIDRF